MRKINSDFDTAIKRKKKNDLNWFRKILWGIIYDRNIPQDIRDCNTVRN